MSRPRILLADDHVLLLEAFRALHASGCFVVPNPWDVGSARFLAHAGFHALASSFDES